MPDTRLGDLPEDVRVYLRPTGFIDAPFGHDGKALRLAGGLLWFSAVELIAAQDEKRVRSELVPVERLEATLAELAAGPRASAESTLARLTAERPALRLGERTLRFDQPHVMGILNMTPDSFSDGGRNMDADAAASAAVDMAAAGASIIDIGGESTRPGAQPVWEGDELARVQPVLQRLKASGAVLSIDTRKASVMEAALDAGAHIVNDVSALTFDDAAIGVVARSACPVVLMHHQGDPQTMQDQPSYADPLIEVYDWLQRRIAAAEAGGIARERIIIDPGIGFGKRLRHNLDLLNGLALFHGLGCPILLGASRKRLIGALANEAPVEERLGGSIALAMTGLASGVQILRVHDVRETVQAAKVWRGLRDAALTPPLS
ncbi:dihydropteroate synthase [Tardibacter chloracetimidivorans]|uniref:Dihydropteroate synthase n=1 Tax=Tardibacter chloracetimidivorans TaxID=1921510 RepID=A0A1L3ZR01_9SPHN|nr:dihydropteroate synthase [Tardibacter chloracetimidivorans]API58054.1 dihydropteroate synthase [Tardibacter chloracetimidivorans]